MASKEYQDRCFCGEFVTQEDIDRAYCPECGRNISNLTERWNDWEEQQTQALKDFQVKPDKTTGVKNG